MAQISHLDALKRAADDQAEPDELLERKCTIDSPHTPIATVPSLKTTSTEHRVPHPGDRALLKLYQIPTMLGGPDLLATSMQRIASENTLPDSVANFAFDTSIVKRTVSLDWRKDQPGKWSASDLFNYRHEVHIESHAHAKQQWEGSTHVGRYRLSYEATPPPETDAPSLSVVYEHDFARYTAIEGAFSKSAMLQHKLFSATNASLPVRAIAEFHRRW